MRGNVFDKETVERIEKIYMEMEGDYVLQLLQIKEFEEYVKSYYSLSNEQLMSVFMNNQTKMENGEVTEADEEAVELEMIACVLAMADKVKRLILTKTPTYDRGDNLGHGRTH